VSLDVRARTASTVHPEPDVHLRMDSEVVLVPVTVADTHNRPITGLDKDQFQLFDDKVQQTVTHFALEDGPLSVGLVFDVSASMGTKLRRSRLAASAFFRASNPEDEFFLVTFNDHARLAVPLTADPSQIENQLAFTGSKGTTALLDAIYMAVNELKKSNRPRKALLVVSDGGDNASRYSESEVKSLVRESDVLIYAIGIYEPFGSRSRTPEEMYGPSLLDEIAEQTGGREFPVDDLRDLPDAAAKIGLELRNQYMLGYSPTDSQRDGRYHRLQVKVVQSHGMPKMQAHWRAGYYAPND
jgi:VWFA-related protein